MPEIVLGVDPGVSETGWAVLRIDDRQAARLVASGLIKTSPGPALPDRLRAIHAELSAVIEEHRPDSIAVEEMFFAKVANTIRNTLQARGVILLAAAQARRTVSEYNPRTVKLTLTGSGGAEKAQMQAVVQKALGLAKKLTPDDVADAAAIALCHARSSRFKRLKVLDSFGARG
jgi:crossover junction endodeoxyribonuclease RuvC